MGAGSHGLIVPRRPYLATPCGYVGFPTVLPIGSGGGALTGGRWGAPRSSSRWDMRDGIVAQALDVAFAAPRSIHDARGERVAGVLGAK
jgi:hypothetical protein